MKVAPKSNSSLSVSDLTTMSTPSKETAALGEQEWSITDGPRYSAVPMVSYAVQTGYWVNLDLG